MHFNHYFPINPIHFLSLTYARSMMRFLRDGTSADSTAGLEVPPVGRLSMFMMFGIARLPVDASKIYNLARHNVTTGASLAAEVQ